jgi:hypothetical protein
MRHRGPLSGRVVGVPRWLPGGAALALFLFLSLREGRAQATGLPLTLTIEPAIVRAQETKESTIVATVTLKDPSPTFFICNLHSSDPEKVRFANLIFKKGQLQGLTSGVVYWPRIHVGCDVRISAFSEDAPGEKLFFTITLKPKDDTAPVANPAAAGI